MMTAGIQMRATEGTLEHRIQLPEVVSVVESRGRHLKTGAASYVVCLFCSTPYFFFNNGWTGIRFGEL